MCTLGLSKLVNILRGRVREDSKINERNLNTSGKKENTQRPNS